MYFFVKGMEWVCRIEEWDGMLDGFDNTWGIVKEFGESSMSLLCRCRLVSLNCVPNLLLFWFFSSGSSRDN